jgi:hypothetical protein
VDRLRELAGALIWLSIILMPALNALAGSFYDDNHVFSILETICVTAFAVSFILEGHGQPSNPDFNKAARQPPPAAIRLPADEDAANTGTRRQPAGQR